MSLFNVCAPVNALNPVRTLAWNATIRAGDDVKIAFTLLDDDCETPIGVDSARALLSLYRMDEGCGRWDYGMSHGSYWDGPYGQPAAAVYGVVQDDADGEGRINFFLPAAASVGLCAGRYRAFISVDCFDGVSTEIEGLIQVRRHARNTLGNAAREYFTIGQTAIGHGLFPPRVIGGVPCDADGFPLAWLQYPPIVVTPPVNAVSTTSVLGRAVLGRMILGSSYTAPAGSGGIVTQHGTSSGAIGQGAIGLMTIGSAGGQTPDGSDDNSLATGLI